MKTNRLVTSTILLVAFSSTAVQAQNPDINVTQQLQINVMPMPISGPNGPNGIGGPNLSGSYNINVDINNDNNVNFIIVDNGTLSNVAKAINVNPVLSNVAVSNVSKPAVSKPTTGNVVKPTGINVSKPITTTATVSRSAAPQQVASRGAAPVSRSVVPRSAPVQQTAYRNVTPVVNKPVAQRSAPAPKPVVAVVSRSVPAPAPEPEQVVVSPAVVIPQPIIISAPIENVAIQSNLFIEAPQEPYRNVANETQELNTTPNRGNGFELPKITLELPTITPSPSPKEEIEVVADNVSENETVRESKERDFSMPSVSFKGKSATAKRAKIKAPKKGNKNFYTQKYSSKISFRVRFTQTKKAFKSAVSSKSKKKIKVAPKVCFAF